jgi:hypothetical protein
LQLHLPLQLPLPFGLSSSPFSCHPSPQAEDLLLPSHSPSPDTNDQPGTAPMSLTARVEPRTTASSREKQPHPQTNDSKPFSHPRKYFWRFQPKNRMSSPKTI